MKILHKSKRTVPPHPQVADVISNLLSTPNDDLPQVLAQIDSWKWPRSDLNAWIKVLNKFDSILEDVIRDYDVDKLQVNVFTPITKKTLCEILRFERLLLENSTNRKMFNSYDRLNCLLFTSDLDVLVFTLNLLLRPSQQYSAQPSVSHALNISTPRLQSLAKRWPNLREYGVGLVNLTSTTDRHHVNGLPIEAREVNYSFYRTEGDKSREQEKKMETDPFEVSQGSPRKQPSSGAINIHIDEQTLHSKSAFDVLADTVEACSVPYEERFELMCRIRSAQALAQGKEVDREKLVIVRLLAIAIFGHTHSESQAMSSLFLYEPDLIIHIAEVLQIDRDTPVSVQTAAIASLDALARYRNKIQEVLTAVNAGVNHGILMALVRKTVADVGNPDSTLPHSFIEALLSFLTFISSHASGGNMVVGAGLVPLLIQVIENRLPQRLPVVSKAMQLVDNVLYSFQNAFQLFCTARGVEVLVERIEFEVDLDISGCEDEQRSHEIFGSYGELPVARSAVLKHILRSMHRMMQSSGTAEGLRGLIDSTVLKSVKSILGNRGLFGPSIIPIAINIMATFVHNEPTSLAIIQEAGLPEVFYRAIEAGLEPAIEVIQAIPNAIGALCLNQAGQDQLAGRPSIIPAIFSIFTSDRHLKVLLDKENAVLIGTAIDELIRHHPSLKTPVFDSLKSTLSKIEELGEAYVIPQDLSHWYKLLPISTSFGHVDVPMEDVETDEDVGMPVAGTEQSDGMTFSAFTADDEQSPKPHDNNVVNYIDVLGRFLEGLFQHVPHCRDFISTTDGLERIGRLTALPCLPYDFANSVASDSLVQVMRTMTEVSTDETLVHLAKLVKSSLQETKSFWGSLEPRSRLLPLMDITDEDDVAANQYFRKLVILHIRIALLSDVFATAGYAHGRAAIGLLQTLVGSSAPDIVADLGALHRVSIWENIILKVGLTSNGMDGLNSPDPSPLERSPDQSSVHLPDVETSTTPNGDQPELSHESPPTPTKKESNAESPREKNAQALKHLTHGLPSSLGPFFQAIVKMFYARRNPDSVQRKQIMESSAVLADMMLQHITQDNFDDTTSGYIYYSIMFGVITLFLVDDRTSQNALHTVQVAAFYRVGGVEAVIAVCRRFMATIGSTVRLKEEDRSDIAKQELGQAYGGLKMALHLLHPLISSKPIFESGQTLLLITRDKKDTDPDYFDSHNFLVKLRLVVLPLLRELWEAPWLISAPLSVSRHVAQAVLELTNGENEEPKGEPTSEGLAGGQSGSSMARSGPDEGRIRQLTDMGFPRSAAERALIRTHNNVNAATELLLAHPFPLPPDPDPERNEEALINAASDEADTAGVVATDGATVADSSAASPFVLADHPLHPVEPAVEGKSAEIWRKELNESRESLKAGIARRALLLVDEHLSLIFDLHTAFVRPTDPHQQESIRELIEDIKAFSPSAYDVQEQPLANRCRLLALVLCETPSSLGLEQRNTLMDSLLALLLSNPVNIDIEHPTIPKWLAAHLLVTESLLTLGNQPRTITLPKEDEPIVPEAVIAGPSYPEARSIVFDFCMRLLAIPSLPGDELLAVLRLFLLLTRHHQTACQFVKRDGISLLFKRLKSSAVPGSQSYIAIILRHIAEDATNLQHIMRQAIKRYFAQPRTHVVEVGTYVRNCSAMALRDSQVFLEATQSLCILTHPFSITPHVSLRGEVVMTDEKALPKTEESSATDMQVDSLNSNTAMTELNESFPSESLESLVHFLIHELMKTSKAIVDHTADTPLSEARIPIDINDTHTHSGPDIRSNVEGQDNPASAGGADHYNYACFLMQCLTELLFSYDSCKVAFLSYSSKKRSQTPAKEVATRHRTAALHFLLSDLISFNTINPQPTPVARNRIMICSWAMSVIVALCVDSSSAHDLKDISSDLVSVRKFVLEAVNRSIKDLSSSENVDGRYGRLLALADLCHRLLTVRINSASRKQADETPTHVAKVMLEKNFVSTLTNALVEVDLNFPNVRGLVASILRPLEHLSKIAIKMSRASGKAKDSLEGKTDSVDSVVSEEEDEGMEGTGREETPDLYRNSALGMYGGEMEDVHFTTEDDMDEDDEDGDEDVEIFGEETGSDDTSNTEDEGEDDLEHDAHGSQEAWDDEGDEDEENLVQNDEDDEEGDDNDGDDDDDDEEADEEMMWQDIHVDGDVPDAGDEVDEEEETGEPIQIIHEQEEREALSDDEDFGNELGIIDDGTQAGPEYVFGLGDTFGNGAADNNIRDGGLFVPRRRSVDNLQIFGRPRNGVAAPPEATTHPLLLDASPAANRNHGQQRNRRNQRGVIAGTTNELVQTIEDLIGGGAVQLFHHITTRGRGGGGPETIRVDVPSGTVNVDRSHGQRRPAGVLSASVRVERAPRGGDTRPDGRGFDPLMTLQRWSEETKILQGDFATERATRLANHVSLALLPAAKEVKIREEQEMTVRREARAKAEEEAAAKEKEKTEEAARKETEAAAKREAEQSSTMVSDTAPQVPEEQVTTDDNVVPAADVDTEMVDASSSALPPSPEEAASNDVAPTGTNGSSIAQGSHTAERVTVIIHGSPVDITDTGIDPTFLEALPDDMREEVLNQHVRDQRASRVERPPDSQISSEFLDALPPEIRAEIIQQERLEQARRRAEEVPPSGRPAGVPAEIDPASFIASLDPQLRQSVLLEQEDGFIQSLPSHMIAEAGAYRDGSQNPRRQLPTRSSFPRSTVPRKLPPPHDAIQLLDKGGIAVLVRLLFFPQVLRKNLLFKVLVNLCENAKTRTELFNLLLNILQDGTGDLAAVDKSFAQMSVRNSKIPSQQTPKAMGKQRAGAEYLNAFAIPNLQNEAVPDLIAQRCLEALTFIVSSNELSSLFFLTEHELPAGLRRAASKKGKGKEKQMPQTHYPIVLLLSLLDRQSLLKTPSIMESVVGLLATVTRPLTSIKSADKKDPEPSTSAAPPAPSVPMETSTAPSQHDATVPQQEVEASAQPTATTSPTDQVSAKQETSIESVEEKILLANPPQIPHAVLRLIVNILTIGECSGRTFQQSLALIQHLSYIPDARDVVAQELKSKAQEFGQSLYSDLDELAAALQSSEGTVLVTSVASKFSPASSEQAKLLRVLKTIDYMYSPKPATFPGPQGGGDTEKVQSIYESFRFTPLWRRLGDCLAVIEQKPDTEHVATVLLPLIEALMVVCKYVGLKAISAGTSRILRASASPRTPITARESMEDLFLSFTDAHRKILNLMVRNNPSLMSGSFSLLVHNPRVLDFDNKRNYFSQQLHRRPHAREHHGTLQLNVRRARVFEDSFQYLQRKTGDQIKYGKLSVRFYDEEGVDAGGVTREWFQILARQMFDPNNALFQPCAADKLTYQPNKNSWVNPEHLSFFKFVGRVIGKAIYDGRLLDAYFARSLYRQLLGKPVDHKDVEWVDPEYYNSLCWILENDPSALDLTFSVEADEFGRNRIVPLKEGGETLPVTQENKREFVQLSAQYRLYLSIKEQIESLLAGFYEVIPKDLVTIFNEQEVELLISGTPDIDVDEWRAATEYNGYSSSDPVIVWWWRALKSFNRDERAKVLSFATGTSRVPLSGFVDLQGVQGVQRFSIHRAYGNSDRLPQAHTCFNQIDLPQYSTYEMLRQQLLLAINEGGEGFGFA